MFIYILGSVSVYLETIGRYFVVFGSSIEIYPCVIIEIPGEYEVV